MYHYFQKFQMIFWKKLFFAEFKSTEQADDAGKDFRKEALKEIITEHNQKNDFDCVPKSADQKCNDFSHEFSPFLKI